MWTGTLTSTTAWPSSRPSSDGVIRHGRIDATPKLDGATYDTPYTTDRRYNGVSGFRKCLPEPCHSLTHSKRSKKEHSGPRQGRLGYHKDYVRYTMPLCTRNALAEETPLGHEPSTLPIEPYFRRKRYEMVTATQMCRVPHFALQRPCHVHHIVVVAEHHS